MDQCSRREPLGQCATARQPAAVPAKSARGPRAGGSARIAGGYAAARLTEATSVGTSRIRDMVPSPLMVAPEMPDTLPI